ncbi:hypothetical protein F5X99DRAFT_406877 [Biscogniauxia marginata]|nr:hypothetical protein F5X99DRAFT_406877 [Biscogniauxia marginata]
MTSVLRLTLLSFAVRCVDGTWFQMGEGAANWGPPKQTAADTTEFNPLLRTPKPTPAPGGRLFHIDLRQADSSRSSTCGFPVDDLSRPAASCQDSAYCVLNRWELVVGCCTLSNSRNCVVPTTCLESTQSQAGSGDPGTIYCADPERPHCVTYAYDANFYDVLNGASFIGCAERGGTGIIATTPLPGWAPPSENTTSSDNTPGSSTSRPSTSTTGTSSSSSTTAVSGTIPPSDSSSSSAEPDPSPSAGNDSGSTNVGAIVGGVVGGVAGLALIVAVVLFLLYRRRRLLQNQDPPEDRGLGNFASPYGNEPPGSYPSTFYGEAPPGMAQTTDQVFMGYPQNSFDPPAPAPVFTRDERTSGEPAFFSPGLVKRQEPQHHVVSPIEPSPVSPISHQGSDANYNTMVSALTIPSPPPQPEYSQFSPPPPEQYHSYRPYPGT